MGNVRKYWILGALFITAITLGCTDSGSSSLDPETQAAVEEATEEILEKAVDASSNAPTPASKEYSDETFLGFIEKFGIDGTLTDLQKDKIFESQYEGKYVEWTCELADIQETMFGGEYYMLLDCPEDPTEWDFDNDISVTIRKDQTDEAIMIMKGEMVTFEGRFKSHIDVWADVAFDDGTIISHS